MPCPSGSRPQAEASGLGFVVSDLVGPMGPDLVGPALHGPRVRAPGLHRPRSPCAKTPLEPDSMGVAAEVPTKAFLLSVFGSDH